MKLDHVGSKTRLPGQILEKPCVLSRGHSFDPKFMELCQKVNPHKNISRSRSKLGHVESKTRVRGQIVEKPCEHFRGHSFDLKLMYFYQNDNPHKI